MQNERRHVIEHSAMNNKDGSPMTNHCAHRICSDGLFYN